jgi:hypothetical protein
LPYLWNKAVHRRHDETQYSTMKSNARYPGLVASLFALLFLTSCGDIQQDLKLNSNGSGTLETTFDLGEMMSMLQGFEDMTPVDEMEETGDEPTDREKLVEPETDPAEELPEEEKDPMQLLIEKVTDPTYPRDFDTLIAFSTIMPDSVRKTEKRMDLVEKLKLRITSPANSASMAFGIVMAFDSPAQLKELVTYMENMDSTTTGIMPNAGTGGIQSESFMVFEADMKAGWIRFDDVDYSEMAGEFGMAGDSTLSEEDLGMMEMMFGNSKIKSVVHVPGEVTSCTNPDAIITKDDKVIVEYGMMDVLRQKKIPGYQINFKPKK